MNERILKNTCAKVAQIRKLHSVNCYLCESTVFKTHTICLWKDHVNYKYKTDHVITNNLKCYEEIVLDGIWLCNRTHCLPKVGDQKLAEQAPL